MHTMTDNYVTPEGLELPRQLVFPDVRRLDELFTVEGPWDFDTMNHRNGRAQPATPREITREGSDKIVGRFMSWDRNRADALPGRRNMVVTPAPELLEVIYECSAEHGEPFAFFDRVSFKAIYHPANDRVLIVADASQIIASRWLAYVTPDSVPAFD
jgi:hypothetical protein